MFHTKIHNKLGKPEIAQWQELWNELPDAHPFNAPGWLLAFQKTFPHKRYCTYFFYDSKELVAVLPVEKRYFIGMTFLSHPDQPQEYLDRSALLAHARKDLGAYITDTLARDGHTTLSAVPENLLKIFPKNRNVCMTHKADNLFLETAREAFSAMSVKARANTQRRLRKVEKDLAFTIHKKDLATHFEVLATLEQKSNRAARGITLFTNAEAVRLYKNFFRTMSDAMRICVLELGGRPIAASCGFHFRDTYLSTFKTYDDHFRTLGPGKLLYHYLHLSLKEENVSKIDFSIGADAMKKEFAHGTRRLYTVQISRNPVIRSLWHLKSTLRRIYHNLKTE